VIAKDEEASIARTLNSVAFADELVVVDSGSTDRTVAIARELGAKVTVTADWPGFGPQKNRALDLATGDWVLSLDADEWLTAESAVEIRRVVDANAAEVAAYRMPRRSSICGRFCATRAGGRTTSCDCFGAGAPAFRTTRSTSG
jgi:glycosyltransferase involved in cell wall biosynthesis